MLKNKTTYAIALFLILAIALPSFCSVYSLNHVTTAAAATTSSNWDAATSAAVAAGMKWDFPGAADTNATATRLLVWERYHDRIPTYVSGVLTPNPVGVGQEMTILLFNPVLLPASYDFNDIRAHFSVNITDPDGNKETLPASGTITSDATETAYTKYTPTKVGNYSITITCHELFYKWYGGWADPYHRYQYNDYYGVTFLESTKTYTLVVQEDRVNPTAVTNYPLPTEYWTRPIEGQNQAWSLISSNWLGGAKDANYGSAYNDFQTDGIAPNSGHILWTKPLEDGGVVGGENFSSAGQVFSAGQPPYQDRMTKPIIMYGRLYYELPLAFNGAGGGWECVDLLTGKEIWYGHMGVSGSGMANINFGYYYDFETINQHGIVNPGWIFAVNGTTWYSVHPLYGTYGQLNITNVPSSAAEVIGPNGEDLRYVIQNAGTTTNPNYRLLQWNSSYKTPVQLIYCYQADLGQFDAGQGAYDWNISLPIANGVTGSITPIAVIYNDVLLCSNGTLWRGDYTHGFDANPDTATLWAVSLKPESLGQTLFGPTNYQMASADGTFNEFVRAGEGVFIMVNLPTYTFSGYSMYTGQKLWEGTPETNINSLGFYSYEYNNAFLTSIAYGKFYSTGYTGHVLCYDLYNGTLLWTYAAPTHAEIIDYYTLTIGAIADGKIYIGAYEHSPNTPLYKGERARCLNATTGQEIWTMLGYPQIYTTAIADGVLVYLNQYDSQIYAVGKGPSQLTVTAPQASIELGRSLIVSGSVTDISAGTTQNEQAMDFPNGVPCVSDASQSAWMEYVYMQKPRPTNTTGVPVSIDVIDSNGNYRNIGTTTSDANGAFSLQWAPDITGKYTVIATFAGSESYWPSSAETSFAVDPAAPTASPYPVVNLPPTETYFAISTVAIIVAIAIVGLLMLRKRP